MAEYIERDQARQVICGWCEYDTCPGYDYYWDKCDAKRRLGDIPSADVKPVVRGEWIKNEGRHGWHCSVCGEDDFYAFAWDCDNGKNELQDRYCPNCGAYLGGVDNG